MMRKDIAICDNCGHTIDSHACYDKGWVMLDGIGKNFRIINHTNSDQNQGRQFEGEHLDFCCIECLHEYFDDMVKGE